MKIRVTEIDIDVEDSQVSAILQHALVSGASVAEVPSLPALQETPQVPGAASGDAVDAIPGTKTARKRTQRKRSTQKAAKAAGSTDGREPIMQRLCRDDLADHERYNAGLRKASQVGDRAMFVLHLAKAHFDVTALAHAEVARVLEDRFALAAKPRAVFMGLQRACRLTPPFVAVRKAKWDPTRLEYWLTQDGADHVEALFSGIKH